MRVLLVSNLYPPDYDGGYEISASKVAAGLRARGVEVDVVTSRFRPGFTPVAEEPWVHRIFEFRPSVLGTESHGLRNKVKVVRILMRNEGMTLRNLPELRRFLKRRRYDVAYVFGLHHVGLACCAALTERGIPILWHFGDHHLANRAAAWADSATYRFFTRTILREIYQAEARLDLRHAAFLSEYLRDYYLEREVPLGKTYVLPRGVEFPLGTDVDRLREEPSVVLMAGRLSTDKGFHVVLQAGRLLAERRLDLSWKMRIVGGGDESYLAELKALADPLGERVEFVPKVSQGEILQMMSRATVFVSASIWGEPFGRTNIEAMGCGTPLVASLTGAILEIVRPGESALVYPKEDAAALSRELEQVLDDPVLRRSLALKGVERVAEAYTMNGILDRTQAILQSIAS